MSDDFRGAGGQLCWKLAFSVLVLKDKKYHNHTENAVH